MNYLKPPFVQSDKHLNVCCWPNNLFLCSFLHSFIYSSNHHWVLSNVRCQARELETQGIIRIDIPTGAHNQLGKSDIHINYYWWDSVRDNSVRTAARELSKGFAWRYPWDGCRKPHSCGHTKMKTGVENGHSCSGYERQSPTRSPYFTLAPLWPTGQSHSC